MVGKEQIPVTNAERHVEHFKEMLGNLIHHVRDDIGKFDEPRAQALFETAAEVLIGLQTACEHYQAGTEAGFRHSK